MDITTGMVVGLFGGLGGALLTLTVQFWRDWASRRRQAAVIRKLLVHELEMLWFDLTGACHPVAAKVFSFRSDVWETYRQHIPNLLKPVEVQAAYRAYFLTKELTHYISREVPVNLVEYSESARKAVGDALRILAGPSHIMPGNEAGDTVVKAG